MGGIYVIKMEKEQFEQLPSTFTALGYPQPAVALKGEIVTYTFKLGFLKRLSVDVIKDDLPGGSYDLWIPPTRSGATLYAGLKKRGYADLKQWHDARHKS
jgi:hypothetical protein